jgi:hypothetical protein
MVSEVYGVGSNPLLGGGERDTSEWKPSGKAPKQRQDMQNERALREQEVKYRGRASAAMCVMIYLTDSSGQREERAREKTNTRRR